MEVRQTLRPNRIFQHQQTFLTEYKNKHKTQTQTNDMTNNENKNTDGSDETPENMIAMKPQDFLDFLGHITHATVISAITAGAMSDDLNKIVDDLENGKNKECLEKLKHLQKGLGLLTSVVCKIGHELTQHDRKVTESCEERGLEVQSVTETHIRKFQENTSEFIDSFFEYKGKMQTQTPDKDVYKKVMKESEKKPFGNNPRFKDLGGLSN